MSERVHQLKRALDSRDRLQRMDIREAREPRHPLVETRVMFHCAGAQWIQPGIDRVILLREARVVPHHLWLREAGQADRALARDAAEPALDSRRLGQVDAGPTGRVLLEDEQLLDLETAIAADGGA